MTWHGQVFLGPSSIADFARRPTTIETVMDALGRLEQDGLTESTLHFYRRGLERFGSGWGFLDQLTVLSAAASLISPKDYLEIGVLRGRSLAVVASRSPDCALYGFDLWQGEYAGLENPGPELVRRQLQRVGHRGSATLVTGDTAETVPAWLEANPQLRFDLVTVDGDHAEEAARRDLLNVLPRVRLGGVIVMDDIVHPLCSWLERVWDETLAAHPDFTDWKYKEVGNGVAFAVRRAETTLPAPSLGEEGRVFPSAAVKLRESESHRQALYAELAAARSILKTLEGELQAVKDDRIAKEKVILALEGDLREVRRDQAAKEDVIQKLKAHTESAGAEIARVRDVVADLRSLTRGRQEQLARASRELNEFKTFAWGLPSLLLRRKRSLDRWIASLKRAPNGVRGTSAAVDRPMGEGPVRVGVDALQIQFGRSGGVEVYLKVLLQALAEMPGVFAEVLCTSDQEPSLSKYVAENVALRPVDQDFNPVRRGREIRARLIGSTAPRAAIVSPSFAGLRERLDLELLHSPVQIFTSPDFDVPGILNLHDLQHLHYPENFTAGDLQAREMLYARSVGLASAVIASSNHVRDDLVGAMQVPSRRVHVIPVACNPEIESGLLSFPPAAARAEYLLPPEFAFYPAQFWPHKNHARLVEALAILLGRNPDSHLKLVLTGSREFDGWRTTKAAIERNHLEDSVFILDFVPTEHLAALYRSAEFCVVPSLFEASSYPVIEAQVLGCPAMCSNVTSLPELVADGCGLLFDPLSPEDIAQKMEGWIRDPEARLEAARRGQERARREHSLSTYAARLFDLYRGVVEETR